MRVWLQRALVSLGLSTLCAVWMIAPLDRAFFHWSGSATGFVFAHVLDFVLVWVAVFCVLRRLDRPGRLRLFGWSALICFSPFLALVSWSMLPGTNVPGLLRLALGLLCLLVWLVAVSLFRLRFAPFAEQLIGAASVFLAFLSITGVLAFAQAGWLAWSLRQPASLPAGPLLQAASAHRPRIIWIVMDELSYRQLYERRLPGLALPAFDGLAAQSTVFTHVTSAAEVTELAIPGYLTGLALDQDSIRGNRKLLLHRADGQRWFPFDQHDTVFQDAHNAGYRTGLSGWYMPYCRLAPAVLDRCFWAYSQPNRNGMVSSASTVSNALAPLRRVALAAMPAFLHADRLPVRTGLALDSQQHAQDYTRILDAADDLLRDPSVGFVMLHLPIPHMPGIFDRSTRSLSDRRSGYIDNLALADRCLAHLRLTLEQTGQWNSSTVLVMGDHGWRIYMPANMLHDPGGDDMVAANGVYDPRPAYLVKLAGQQTAETIDTPYKAVDTRRLLDALLSRQIQTPADLDTWVRSRP